MHSETGSEFSLLFILTLNLYPKYIARHSKKSSFLSLIVRFFFFFEKQKTTKKKTPGRHGRSKFNRRLT